MNKNHKLTLGWLVDNFLEDDILSEKVVEKLKSTPLFIENNVVEWIEKQKIYSDKWHCLLAQDIVVEWIAKKLNQKYKKIDANISIAPQAMTIITPAFLRANKIFVLEVSESTILIATIDPFMRNWEDKVKCSTNLIIQRVLISVADLNYCYKNFFISDDDNLIYQNQNIILKEINSENIQSLLDTYTSSIDNSQHIETIVNYFFNYAIKERASDIHFEPKKEKCLLRFRIDGLLSDIYNIPLVIYSHILNRIKVLGNMDITEKRLPQDGRLTITDPDNVKNELRLSTMPTIFGEKIVVRLSETKGALKDLTYLGFSYRDQQIWHNIINQKSGIALVTGPTGSGKTVTLYTSLQQISSSNNNICTIEDPIEIVEPNFNQFQVNDEIGLTFAKGMKYFLRQDPDVIMVGEIRDKNTADMAIQASLTGHLVLSTLHANSAAAAIMRLLDIGISSYLIRDTVTAIVAQRLVRNLCQECKEINPLSKFMWSTLTSDNDKYPRPKTIYVAVGCSKCQGTGYKGRTGIYELLIVSPAIQELIDDADSSTYKITQKAVEEGMSTLREDAIHKVLSGITSVEEVIRIIGSSIIK